MLGLGRSAANLPKLKLDERVVRARAGHTRAPSGLQVGSRIFSLEPCPRPQQRGGLGLGDKRGNDGEEGDSSKETEVGNRETEGVDSARHEVQHGDAQHQAGGEPLHQKTMSFK